MTLTELEVFIDFNPDYLSQGGLRARVRQQCADGETFGRNLVRGYCTSMKLVETASIKALKKYCDNVVFSYSPELEAVICKSDPNLYRRLQELGEKKIQTLKSAS